jgi:4-amino-4-deoxy-L-arabinose transferase-like glycosyltransferase
MDSVEKRLGGRGSWVDMALIVGVGLLIVALRLTGVPDLMDNDQAMPAAYAVDIIENGSWIVQRDERGVIASKPPVYQWMVATVGMLTGTGVNQVTLALPGAVGVIGCALLVYGVGVRWFGRRAALIGAVAMLVSPFGVKFITLVRVDGLFALGCFAAMLLAWRGWRTGNGWVVFWIVCALVTLTKTPIAVILALAGLAAAGWERDGKGNVLRWSQVVGFVCFLGIAGGWLLLAYLDSGQALIDKLFRDELIGHATGTREDRFFGRGFIRSPQYFVSRYLPWSIPAIIAMWRVVRHPAVDESQRRLERFLFCAALIGFLMFCTAAKPRADHLLPIIPAVSLLAGREVACWVEGWSARRLRAAGAVVIGASLGLGVLHYHYAYARDDSVQVTIGMRELAAELRGMDWSACGGDVEFVFVDAPFALQYYLDEHRRISLVEAAELICSGAEGVVIAVWRFEELEAMLDERGCEVRWPVVGQWLQENGRGVRVLSGCGLDSDLREE